MRFTTWRGPCAALGCEGEGIRTARTGFGLNFEVDILLCNRHLVALMEVLDDLEGHDLAAVVNKRPPAGGEG